MRTLSFLCYWKMSCCSRDKKSHIVDSQVVINTINYSCSYLTQRYVCETNGRCPKDSAKA